jgi:hypothetical protein
MVRDHGSALPPAARHVCRDLRRVHRVIHPDDRNPCARRWERPRGLAAISRDRTERSGLMAPCGG